MESTHRQLSTRLTDRLGCDDPDSFAPVDHATPTQITPITMGTQAPTGFTGQWGTDFDLINPQLINQANQVLIKQGTGFNERFLRIRVNDINRSYPAQNTITQGFYHLAAIEYGLHGVTPIGTTVLLGNDQILRSEERRVGKGGRSRGATDASATTTS